MQDDRSDNNEACPIKLSVSLSILHNLTYKLPEEVQTETIDLTSVLSFSHSTTQSVLKIPLEISQHILVQKLKAVLAMWTICSHHTFANVCSCYLFHFFSKSQCHFEHSVQNHFGRELDLNFRRVCDISYYPLRYMLLETKTGCTLHHTTPREKIMDSWVVYGVSLRLRQIIILPVLSPVGFSQNNRTYMSS